MKRKTLIIIVASVLVVILIGTWLSLRNTNNNTGTTLVQKAASLFPFGKNAAQTPPENVATTPTITNEGGTSGGETAASELPRLRLLSSAPVAGATSITKKREVPQTPAIETSASTDTTTQDTPVTPSPEPVYEEVSYVRYVDKGTGNIYDIAVDEASPTRITNTTIPRVSEALFADMGQRVILRYLEGTSDVIETWDALMSSAPADNGLYALSGSFLDQNITTLSVSPDTKNIFYMEDIGDVTYGYTAASDGTNKKQIFDTSFSEWISEWARDGEISLTAKASGFLEGYSYKLSSDGKTFSKILGPTFGLTRLTDPSGTYSLYGFSTANGMQLRILNEKTGESSATAVTTLPEKCVASKREPAFFCAVPKTISKGAYPDDWYKGTYTSIDSLWKIDAIYGLGFQIADLYRENNTAIDAMSLGMSDDGSLIYFINKKDDMLWGFAL